MSTPGLESDHAKRRGRLDQPAERQRSRAFQPIGRKEDPPKVHLQCPFSRASNQSRRMGLQLFASRLRSNVRRTVEFYNEEMGLFAEPKRREKISATTDNVGDFINKDATKISWSRSLKSHLLKGTEIEVGGIFGVGAYRPFNRQFVYYDRFLNHERAQLAPLFPTPDSQNIGFYVTGPGSD